MTPIREPTEKEKLMVILEKIQNAKKQLEKFQKAPGVGTPEGSFNAAAVQTLKQELAVLGAEYRRIKRVKNGI